MIVQDDDFDPKNLFLKILVNEIFVISTYNCIQNTCVVTSKVLMLNFPTFPSRRLVCMFQERKDVLSLELFAVVERKNFSNHNIPVYSAMKKLIDFHWSPKVTQELVNCSSSLFQPLYCATILVPLV